MLPRILRPEQLQGFRFSDSDHCRLSLLHDPEQATAATVFLEIHDPSDRVPPHAHHHAAELFFVLRGQVLFHVGEACIRARGGDVVVVPEDAFHDLENPGPGRLYLLTVLSGDADFAEVLRHGIPTPLDAEDLAVLRSL
ncbi:cupin domain-containing protein [Vulcanococcus limneticus]|uniref:cupin domain-containing protein n=1 Tax=Vulcanococcus limneticus TaxID=2170428 RepID=UPI000B97F511|nr:cupin domain-containing protein [Vulcanococcus limneticus]MCP9790379.1 cupin domain-containing protein [Vulcanococcus limneticus MW73D5]MCP9892400.1 cupin domain-containing protein [Vulcanococcus limneticus Candia 3F8]MCP9895778.1 cupin domain-containing protein [Vulcanococcus limneticus Candia 3B3]